MALNMNIRTRDWFVVYAQQEKYLERILTTEGLMEDAVILMISFRVGYANHLIQLVRNSAEDATTLQSKIYLNYYIS